MRRTQLYLEDDVWSALRTRARSSRTSISELVREAVRERYFGQLDERKRAMQAFVGIRRNRPEFSDSTDYIRNLRRGTRIQKLKEA